MKTQNELLMESALNKKPVEFDSCIISRVDLFDNKLNELVESPSLPDFMSDLISQDGIKGNPDGPQQYEISKYMTKSKQTVLIDYTRTSKYDADNDTWKMIIDFE